MGKIENTKRILEVVKQAFLSYKENFDRTKDSTTLFKNFTNVLDTKLGEYEILYDYVIGKDTTLIEGKTLSYFVKDNDTIIMDISVKYKDTWIDVTRTFFVGYYTKEQESTYNLIINSIKAGEKVLKSGSTGNEIYNAVNKVFLNKDKELIHHAGHIIDINPVETPEFVKDEFNKVASKQIVAIESGLYDDYGIRLENNYLVNESGNTNLFEELMPLDIKEYVL